MIDARKVLLAGDTHGNVGWWKFAIFPEAKKYGVDAILQHGDFGLWPGDKGAKYLDKVSRYATNWGIPVYWLDGNHEWFDRLIELGAFGAQEPTEVAQNVFYVPRGYAWHWGGVKCLALGGAVSIDKACRLPGRSWWPQEMITDADVDRAIANGIGAKIMFTHDTVAGYNVPGVHADYKQNQFPLSEWHRTQLSAVFDVVQPELLVHGHYHQGYSDRYKGCHIIGLDCDAPTNESWGNYRDRSIGILELADNDWSFKWTFQN